MLAIDTLEAIQAGGTTQWIRIRGADASNPVLLLIQQGPGLPMINETRRFEHLLGLEQAFTVVYWDQRGCGRSLRRRQGPGRHHPGGDGRRHRISPGLPPEPLRREDIRRRFLFRSDGRERPPPGSARTW